MHLTNRMKVLRFGKHIVVFDYSRYVIILPNAPVDELERIQSSALYRYYENELTDTYCKVFGIETPFQIIYC